MLKKEKNRKVEKRKEYGLHIIEGSLYAFASSEGKITDKDNIKGRISLVKEKLKREVLINRITITGISDISEIDKLPPHKKITIYLNPYYELEVVKNLEPFPICTDNQEGLNWLNNFETYLAINFLYYKEFRKPLKEKDKPDYTNSEIVEAKEIIIDYYDLENPITSPLEVDQSLLYYHPKPNLVKNAEEDILTYELALLAKALTNKYTEDIAAETGFDKDKIKKLLKILIERADDSLAQKAKEVQI